ncbi:hypothetical protein D3C76_1577700 [compost metagenome]
MRQFVHQNQGGAAGKGGVEIKLGDQTAAVVDAPSGLCRQPLQQRRCLLASVGFHHANQNIQPLGP